MLRENSKNFVDETQNEQIDKGGTVRWLETLKIKRRTEAGVLYVGHLKRRHSLEKIIM